MNNLLEVNNGGSMWGVTVKELTCKKREGIKMGKGDYSADFESIRELVKQNHCSPNCPYIDLYYDEMDQEEYGKRVIEVSCSEFKKLHNPYIEEDKIKLCPILYFIYHEETTPEPDEQNESVKYPNLPSIQPHGK